VVTIALMHSLLPNKATGKEPSQSSCELSISGLRRFISSGFTYTYLFLKKSRKNEKVYSITVVLDNTHRIFSFLNIKHTITTTTTLLESFAHVPGGDGIIIDFILASHNSVNILLHGVPVQIMSSPSLLSELLTVAKGKTAMHSGIIIFVIKCKIILFIYNWVFVIFF
jgi:ABC-type transporter Mla MlaB component